MTHRISQVTITTEYGLIANIHVRAMDYPETENSEKCNAPAIAFNDLPFDIRLALSKWVNNND